MNPAFSVAHLKELFPIFLNAGSQVILDTFTFSTRYIATSDLCLFHWHGFRFPFVASVHSSRRNGKPR